jgi:LPXTG-motif cell wall-anchored protein
VLVLALAAPALASPTTSAYGGSGATATAQTTGTLPFTGINDSGVAAVGLALVATGLVMRRKQRPTRS